jgi:hypothetical protein
MDGSAPGAGAGNGRQQPRRQSNLPRSGPPLPLLTATPPLRAVSSADASPPSPAEALPRSIYRVGQQAQYTRRNRQSTRSLLSDSDDSSFDLGTPDIWRRGDPVHTTEGGGGGQAFTASSPPDSSSASSYADDSQFMSPASALSTDILSSSPSSSPILGPLGAVGPLHPHRLSTIPLFPSPLAQTSNATDEVFLLFSLFNFVELEV